MDQPTGPANEAERLEEQRLQALYRYDLLDTDPEDLFDRVTRLAASHFDTPASVISLIDRDRIWFKSTFGVEAREVGRNPGLCATAMGKDGVYHLRDASLDPIARDHPLVRPSDGVRFYAAHALITADGFRLGTICVMGPTPRDLSASDRETLESLAVLTMNEIERRYTQAQLAELNSDLDTRVESRTRDLDVAVAQLEHEVGERSQALERLRMSEMRQRRIAELGSDFCFEVELASDHATRLEWVTGPVFELTGYRLDEIDLLNWNQYVHEDDQHLLPPLFERAIAGETAEAEYRFLCKDGAHRWVRIQLRISPDSARAESTSFLASIKDLQGERSARALADARSRDLAKSQRELREARKLAWLGTIAAGIAHQVNNPIGAALAATEYALSCEGDPDEREIWKSALESSRSEALRCGAVVRSILQFSRRESAPREEADLAELVATVARRSRSYAEDHATQIRLNTNDQSIPIQVSKIDIEEVVVNVLRNAIEAGPRTGVDVKVSHEGAGAIIAISDDGPGIPPHVLRNIFEPFFTTRLADGGTGLGLSVAHGIVADHHGEIDVRTNVGKGTAITIRLPSDPAMDTLTSH